MPKYDFSNKTVVVTGGTRGIGAEISRAFLDAGATVFATYAGNKQAAEGFQAERSKDGERLKTVLLDSSDYKAAESFFKPFLDGDKKLDVLVNNSGIRKDNALAMMPIDDWKKVIDVNLTGVFVMSKFAVMAMMRDRRGRIINITSPSGKLGFEGQANYAASKAGMVALTKSLSKEAAKRNITVNCVSPGFIQTDLVADIAPEKADEYKKMVPLRKFGLPKDVANAVLFLADNDAGYITGTVLEVTGGI